MSADKIALLEGADNKAALTNDEIETIRRMITFGRQTRRTELEVPISTLQRLLARVDPARSIDMNADQMEALLTLAAVDSLLAKDREG